MPATALLLIAAGNPPHAQQSRPEPPGAAQRSPTSAATLRVWNRPIAEFRATVRHLRPSDRAANAARRIEMLPAGVRAEEIHVEPISLGDLHGVLISVRGHALFAIADADLDASTNETLESVSAWSVAQLQSVLQARAEQRRPTVVLRALTISLARPSFWRWSDGRRAVRRIVPSRGSRRSRTDVPFHSSGATCGPSSLGSSAPWCILRPGRLSSSPPTSG